MRNKLLHSIFGLLAIIAIACEKNDNSNPSRKVELYLIDNYSQTGNLLQIDENSVVTENSPLVYYSDFLSYDSTNCRFELSERARKAIYNLKHSVHGLAFAIKANDTLIYTGYFWPSYSSASCNWVVIDPMSTSSRNTIRVVLGYPGLIEGQSIPDKRNDAKIIRILKNDNKLK